MNTSSSRAIISVVIAPQKLLRCVFSLAALMALHACGTSGVPRPSPTGNSHSQNPPLKFCRPSKYSKLVEDEYDKDLKSFRSSSGIVYSIPGPNRYSGCDVVIKTKVLRRTAGHITGEAVSRYSDRAFPLTYFNFFTVEPWNGMFKRAVNIFEPGSTEYHRIIAERGKYQKNQKVLAVKRKKEQAVRQERERLAEEKRQRLKPVSGMTKEDLQALVSAAVRGTIDARAQNGTAARPGPGTKAIASDVDTPNYKVPTRTDDFAVVVGIDGYSELPRARFAERDAVAVSKHLEALGYPRRNIITLLGAKAGRAGLVKNLETWLPLNVKKRSNVFFYFSGHGSPDPKTGQAYLVPWDGDPRYLKDTAYPVTRLYKKLRELKAQKIIVALDSCFSGAGGRSVLPEGTRPLVNKIKMGNLSGDKIVVISASRGDEISGTIEKQGHGVFTYYLLRGLNGAAKNDSGQVTIRSLYDYLVPNVEDAARRQNRSQTPQLTPPASPSMPARVLR